MKLLHHGRSFWIHFSAVLSSVAFVDVVVDGKLGGDGGGSLLDEKRELLEENDLRAEPKEWVFPSLTKLVTQAPTYEETYFTPAEPLKVFKKIDPDEFEWINPDNIEAGATTCGFLKPDLGLESGIEYPKIKVYMCVKFAKNQPAPKGNLVVHCGGPGSLSDCINLMGDKDVIGANNVKNYNIISIDQRGTGRSEPSFVHPECNYASPNQLEFTESEVKDILNAQKDVVEACWSLPEFLLSGRKTDDGSTIALHFLEYSGTRQLAEDLARFMVLIKAEKLSLYGISYGTNVMGTFATIFPNRVDKFVIDSNMLPTSDLEEFSEGKALGMDMRTDYMLYTCWAARIKDPQQCPIEDLRQCITFIQGVLLEKEDYLDTFDSFVDNILKNLTTNTDRTATYAEICQLAAKNDTEGVYSLLLDDAPQKRSASLVDCDSYDGPTTDPGDGPVDCYAVPAEQYANYENIIVFMVDGMDYAGGREAYNDEIFVKRIMDFQEESTNAALYFSLLLSNYYWPKNIPLPIRGSPNIEGIVSGQLYDKLTEYSWTQQMRGNFPFTHLLTSQNIQHGQALAVDGKKGPCQDLIIKYFQTGQPDFVDGTVCGDPYPYFNNLVRY